MGTMMEIEDSGPGEELFALTDEQILGIEAEAGEGDEDSRSLAGARDDRSDEGIAKAEETQRSGESKGTQAGAAADSASSKPVPLEAPKWLAERMKDPWNGEEARELWEGAQRAQREAGEYREVFATPADARALKELYPGGVGEAKVTAEQARQLKEIDAAYFGGEGKAPAELSAGRAQLAQRLMEQDPAAFREMVMAGVKLLELAKDGKEQSIGKTPQLNQHAEAVPRSPRAELQKERMSGGEERVIAEYRSFERTANEELERRVGGAIEKTMEQALPNLGRMAAGQQSNGLSERLKASVREEVDAALRSDGQLGEQVAKVLAGRRFDEATRGQVVRLIDARAQQLVPGAVRRVVSGWTQTAMAARRGEEKNVDVPARRESVTKSETKAPQAAVTERRSKGNEKSRGAAGRLNYGRLSDEDILEL